MFSSFLLCRPPTNKLARRLVASSRRCAVPSPFNGGRPLASYATACARFAQSASSIKSNCFVAGRTTLHPFFGSLPIPILQAASYVTSSTTQEIQSPLKDDSHPSLFYHLFEEEELHPVFALSFIEDRPRYARSPTVSGWLPAVSPGSEEGESGLNDFVTNKSFLPILHETVKKNLLDDDIWTNAAIQTQSGWMHIFDQRNPPPLGRTPDPDDILASVRVEDGRMLIDTYQAMPTYRLCTSDGVCLLTDILMDRLKVTLKRIAEEERQNH